MLKTDQIDSILQGDDQRALQALIDDAHEHGDVSIKNRAKIALIELKTAKYANEPSLVRQIEYAIAEYEEVLRQKHGRRYSASRTRSMIRQYGYKEALSRIVNRGRKTVGFDSLRQFGLTEYAFEKIVLDHKTEFSNEIIRKATAAMKSIK